MEVEAGIWPKIIINLDNAVHILACRHTNSMGSDLVVCYSKDRYKFLSVVNKSS